MNRKGYTKIELICAIAIVMIAAAIIVPLWLHFAETENQAMDSLEAAKGEDLARLEYMMSHYPDGGKVVYFLTGTSDAQKILRHFQYLESEPEKIALPHRDGFYDGGAADFGGPAVGRSKRVGKRELYVIVGENGQIVYNSWLDILRDPKTSAFDWDLWFN